MTALSASAYQAGIAFQTDNTWTFRNAYGVDGLIRIHRPDGSIDDFDTNASFPNKLQNVAGISNSASQKALDLFLKCRYLDEKTGGKGVVFATGTPYASPYQH